jgi:hypothetical protein
MDCILTAVIASNCRDGVGGNSKVWAVELSAVGAYTETAGALTAFALEGAKVMFAWNFSKDSAKLSSIVQTSNEAGTTFYQQMLDLSFWKWETVKRNEIKLAAVTPLFFIVKDNNGTYWAAGLTRGLDMQSGGEATTGALLGDKSGYTLQFMGDEIDEPIQITDAAFIAALP